MLRPFRDLHSSVPFCTSLSPSTSPERGSSWGCDNAGHGTGNQGKAPEVAQRHREQGQGRAQRHPNGDALCQCGSMGFVSGPFAVLKVPPQL